MGGITSWLRFWFGAIRAPFFIAVITPVFLGTAIAWQAGYDFNWLYFLLVLLGVICVNGGTNLANDYYDRATDDINVEYVAPFTGGSRMIQQGLLTPRQVIIGGLLFFAAAAIIGAYLIWATWASGPMILVLGAIGVFSGFFYTAPPLRLGYRWVAEAIPGLNCGILVTLGAYWIQAQTFSWHSLESWVPVIASIPLAIIISAVLWVNEIPDYAADRAAGKNHMVVLLGKRRAAYGYAALLISAYICIILSAIPEGIPFLALLGLLSFPLALTAMRTALNSYDDSPSLAPANALTPMIYLATGLLITLGFIIDKLL